MANPDNVILEIAAPKGLFKGEFEKTVTVQQVIDAVIEKQQLQGGDVFELFYKGKQLEPVKQTLAEFNLTGVVQLELVATGQGV